MPNQMLVIAPYWLESAAAWVFDDEAVDLFQEPFVSGIPDMIDDTVAVAGSADGTGDAPDVLRHGDHDVMVFPDGPALAFVGGTMNLAFMGLAMLLMTLEKLPDLGAHITKPLGAGLLALALLTPFSLLF